MTLKGQWNGEGGVALFTNISGKLSSPTHSKLAVLIVENVISASCEGKQDKSDSGEK